MSKRYILLEDEICYDWDDYNLWGAVLFDLEEKVVKTSKYGHGSDLKERAECIGIEESVESGLITYDELLSCIFRLLGISYVEAFESIALSHNKENYTAIPVDVVGGRKFKGKGYLVYMEKEPVRYGLGAYRNQYSYRPYIYDPNEKKLHKVNSTGYLKYDTEFIIDYADKVFQSIPKNARSVERLAHSWAYGMSYSSCDASNKRMLLKDIARGAMKSIVIPDEVVRGMKEIADEEERIHQEYLNKLREEKMPGIIEWVKKNTDKKTDDDIMELAEHIFLKHNG